MVLVSKSVKSQFQSRWAILGGADRDKYAGATNTLCVSIAVGDSWGCWTGQFDGLGRVVVVFNRGGRFLGVLTRMRQMPRATHSPFQSRWAILGGADPNPWRRRNPADKMFQSRWAILGGADRCLCRRRAAEVRGFNRGGRFLGVLTNATYSGCKDTAGFNRGGRFLGVLTMICFCLQSVNFRFQSRWAILGGADSVLQ